MGDVRRPGPARPRVGRRRSSTALCVSLGSYPGGLRRATGFIQSAGRASLCTPTTSQRSGLEREVMGPPRIDGRVRCTRRLKRLTTRTPEGIQWEAGPRHDGLGKHRNTLAHARYRARRGGRRAAARFRLFEMRALYREVGSRPVGALGLGGIQEDPAFGWKSSWSRAWARSGGMRPRIEDCGTEDHGSLPGASMAMGIDEARYQGLGCTLGLARIPAARLQTLVAWAVAPGTRPPRRAYLVVESEHTSAEQPRLISAGAPSRSSRAHPKCPLQSRLQAPRA